MKQLLVVHSIWHLFPMHPGAQTSGEVKFLTSPKQVAHTAHGYEAQSL